MSDKLKVGQKVYLKPCELGNAYRRDKEIKESTITKVGRKYVTVNGFGQFDIKTRQEKTIYTSDYEIYFNKEELDNQEEKAYLEKRIKNSIPKYGKWNIELEKLRQIAKIMEC